MFERRRNASVAAAVESSSPVKAIADPLLRSISAQPVVTSTPRTPEHRGRARRGALPAHQAARRTGRARDRARRRESRGARRVSHRDHRRETEGHTWLRIDPLDKRSHSALRIDDRHRGCYLGTPLGEGPVTISKAVHRPPNRGNSITRRRLGHSTMKSGRSPPTSLSVANWTPAFLEGLLHLTLESGCRFLIHNAPV